MPKDRLLISDGNVFDGVSDEFQRQDILIEGERIVEVAPNITADAERFDASGKWVTPGFFDMHVHISNLGWEVLPAYVGNGVTTIRDLGGDTQRLRQTRTDIESGKVVGPNLIYSGPNLQQAPTGRPSDLDRGDGAGSAPFESEAEAREQVTRLIEEEGAGSIKIYESVRPPMAQAILEAADGKAPVTGHLGRTSSKFAMEHGIGGMEHLHQAPIRDLAPPNMQIDPNDWLAVPGYALTVLRTWAEVNLDGPETESWLRTLLDTKSFLDPTVTIASARPPPDDPRRRLFGLPRVAPGPTQQDLTGNYDGGGIKNWAGEEVTSRARANQRGLMRLIYENGGDMVIGTDLLPGAVAGWNHHAEMLSFQSRGVKPIDILRFTTSVSAKHLWRDDLGRITAGALADIVMMGKDPTEDIANVDTISHVVKSGLLHDATKLLAIAPAIGA